jgi:hypothetical protein
MPLPTISTAEWTQMLNANVRVKVTALRKLMHKLDAVKHGGKMKAYARHTEDAGLSVDRLKKLHEAWRREGEYALVDHRLCGGCGLPGCGRARQRTLLHPATVNEWVRLAQANTSVQAKGTRSFERAWETIVKRIISGEEVPGLGHSGEPGTWRDLWARVHPSKPCPPTCDWRVSYPPPGHSLSNFTLRKPEHTDKAQTALVQRGLGAALALMPEVQMDWGTLRPLEMIIIDDKRLDIRSWLRLEDGSVQVVECWTLMAMDACTRRIVWCQMHPRYTRPDGTQVGISHRDVQHLFAKVLATYGVPSYGQTWIVENASAALSHDFDDVVTRVTGGLVKIRRSGLFDGRVLVSGFDQSGGNPRAKALIESFFGHRLDVALGWVRGQMGTRYQLKPGDDQARLAAAQSILRKVGDVATDEELKRLIPLESMPVVRGLLLKAFEDLESREHHQLQGFQELDFWRMSERDQEWKLMTDPLMAELLAEPNGDVIVSKMLAQPGRTLRRMETAIERWQRLYQPALFRAVSPAAFFEMWLDSSAVKYDGSGVFRAKLRGGKVLEFRQRVHPVLPGEQVVIRFDADNLDLGAVIQDAAGRVVAHAQYQGRVAFGDEEALKESLGFKMAAKADLLRKTRQMHDTPEAVRQQIELVEEQTEVITTIRERAGVVSDAPDCSAELVKVFQSRRTRRAAQLAEYDAEDLMAAERAAHGI